MTRQVMDRPQPALLASSTMGSSSRNAAGDTLRAWRRRRRLSQLELANLTGVSTRHLSCLETGKANASRQLLLYLADQLDLPLRDRNELLLAAGYAPRYPHQPLGSEQLRTARDALAELLKSHEPYPAVVMDQHWNIIERNRSAAALATGVAAELAQPVPGRHRKAGARASGRSDLRPPPDQARRNRAPPAQHADNLRRAPRRHPGRARPRGLLSSRHGNRRRPPGTPTHGMMGAWTSSRTGASWWPTATGW